MSSYGHCEIEVKSHYSAFWTPYISKHRKPNFELFYPGQMLFLIEPGHERLFGLNKPGYVFSLFEPGLDLVWEIGDCLGSIN